MAREPFWGKITSIERKHQFILGIYFSNGNFPPRIFSDFSRRTLFLEKLLSSNEGLPQSSYFFRVSAWTQLLLFRSSYFFRAAAFSIFYFFRTISSSQQLFSRKATFSERNFYLAATSPELVALQNSYIFETATFLVGRLVQNKDTHRRVTFLKQLLLHSINFFRRVTFQQRYFSNKF